MCLTRWDLGPPRPQERIQCWRRQPPPRLLPLATLQRSPCGTPPAGYGERTDDAFLRAPLDAAFEARVVEQERRSEAAARSQAGASRPNFSRPLDAGLPDDEYPPPPPPAQDLPPASTSRAHLPPRPASAGPSRSRSIDDLGRGGQQGQSRAVYQQPTLSADVDVDVAASVDGLSHRLAASSSMDDLNMRHSADHDVRRDYDPAAAAVARRRRPASAPRERPRGITIPRPFNFDSRPPRESTSMRRLRLELQERDAQQLEERHTRYSVPLPASTKEPRYGQTILSPEPYPCPNSDRARTRTLTLLAQTPDPNANLNPHPDPNLNLNPNPHLYLTRYEQISADAAARIKQRREGRKEEMLANARPFSFQDAKKKEPPKPEPDLQVVFRATPVPKAVHEPLWEIIQHREAGRQERVAREAQALYQKRQLPPHLAEKENRRLARAEEEHKRIERDVRKDNTFHPKVRASLPPDFGALQRRFEKSLETAKLTNPHRKVPGRHSNLGPTDGMCRLIPVV